MAHYDIIAMSDMLDQLITEVATLADRYDTLQAQIDAHERTHATQTTQPRPAERILHDRINELVDNQRSITAELNAVQSRITHLADMVTAP